MAARRPPEPNPAPPLALGSVLSRTLSTWAQNLPAFSALSLIVFSPLVAWTLLHTSEPRTSEQTKTFDEWSGYLSMLLSSVLGAALVYGVLEHVRGRRAGMAACLSNGLSRILPVLGVSLLTFLYAMLAMIAVMIPSLIVGAASRVEKHAFAYAIFGVGVVIMAIVLTLYYVAVPVAVIERPGVRRSMGRSRDLTRGNRWRIFGLQLIWALPGTLGMASNALFSDDLRAARLASLGLNALLFAPLGAVSSALVYHDLRKGRDGATIEDLTKVFD